jgi:3-carboxy-cis,cis-muconate cycloisomerase
MMLLGLSPALIAPDDLAAVFADAATIQAMLDFERALAQAEAACGVIPEDAAGPIAAACDATLYDPAALAIAARLGGTVAIPLAKALGDQVRRADPAAAGWVHFGATSQDVVDTGLVLQLRRASVMLLRSANAVAAYLRHLVRAHAQTAMLGRTLMQPGPPITFGLKAAGWLGAIERGAARVRETAAEAFVLQFGGAVGTLAALGDRGVAVSAKLGEALGLPVPPAPWHAHRDRLAAFSASCVILGGTCGKIARDITLMMQAELAEVAEPGGAGRGGSSTMPHKRNPVASVTALAAANRLPGLLASVMAGLVVEHERAAGSWQAEAGLHAEICLATGGALAAMEEALGGLAVDPAAMARNIANLRGLVLAERLMLALAPKIGRGAAHELVETLVKRCTGDITLQSAAADEPRVTDHLPDLDTIFDPAGYLGSTAAFIDRSLGET